jgi:hypothetical protein
MINQREAKSVTVPFTQDVLISGARLVAEDVSVYGSASQRFAFELDAINQVMSESAGVPGMAPLNAQQLAGARLIALGRALARADEMTADVLSRGVALLGALSQVSAQPAADERAARAGQEAVGTALVNAVGPRHETSDAA